MSLITQALYPAVICQTSSDFALEQLTEPCNVLMCDEFQSLSLPVLKSIMEGSRNLSINRKVREREREILVKFTIFKFFTLFLNFFYPIFNFFLCFRVKRPKLRQNPNHLYTARTCLYIMWLRIPWIILLSKIGTFK